ncbi:MAG: hypothetical protein PGN26_02360 [Xylophilus ampelinus]
MKKIVSLAAIGLLAFAAHAQQNISPSEAAAKGISPTTPGIAPDRAEMKGEMNKQRREANSTRPPVKGATGPANFQTDPVAAGGKAAAAGEMRAESREANSTRPPVKGAAGPANFQTDPVAAGGKAAAAGEARAEARRDGQMSK